MLSESWSAARGPLATQDNDRDDDDDQLLASGSFNKAKTEGKNTPLGQSQKSHRSRRSNSIDTAVGRAASKIPEDIPTKLSQRYANSVAHSEGHHEVRLDLDDFTKRR